MYSISEKHFHSLYQEATQYAEESKPHGIYQSMLFTVKENQFTWEYDVAFKFTDYAHTQPEHIVIIMTCGVVRNGKFSRLYHLPSPIMKVTN